MEKRQQEHIGNTLKTLREKAGITRKDMAQRLNVTYAMLNLLETGRTGCSLDVFLRFLQECNVAFFDINDFKAFKEI